MKRLGIPVVGLAIYILGAVYLITPPPQAPWPILGGDPFEVTTSNLPGDCAVVATEAYHRVVAAAGWARLLHLDYASEDDAHMVCVWQLRPNDPILIYDRYFLDGSTLELPTAKRDAKLIASLFSDAINRQNWSRNRGIKITGGHFVE